MVEGRCGTTLFSYAQPDLLMAPRVQMGGGGARSTKATAYTECLGEDALRILPCHPGGGKWCSASHRVPHSLATSAARASCVNFRLGGERLHQAGLGIPSIIVGRRARRGPR